ncbi:MAG: hypothetical protein JWM78_2735 [Verrucomicrobiaceae bacterium]|nr:hypothetical protein [Verrucomicrobiaceae bacterium]
MKKDTYFDLDMHRPPSRKNDMNGVKLQNIQAVKARLLEEIIELESKLDKIKGSGDPIDLSLIQTYREMIHGRRSFFAELNR